MAAALDVVLGVVLTATLGLVGYFGAGLVNRIDTLATKIDGIITKQNTDGITTERRLTRVESILDLRDILNNNGNSSHHAERRQHPRLPD